MESADKATLIAVNTALNAALTAAGRDVDVDPVPGGALPLIVTGTATERETRPHKMAVEPEVTRTIRIYSHSKIDAMDLAALCVETLTRSSDGQANFLDLSAHGFEVLEQRLELSQPVDRTTDTGTEYSYAQRYRFTLRTLQPA